MLHAEHICRQNIIEMEWAECKRATSPNFQSPIWNQFFYVCDVTLKFTIFNIYLYDKWGQIMVYIACPKFRL